MMALDIYQVQNEDCSAKVVAESMIDAIRIFIMITKTDPSLVTRETDDDDHVILPPDGFKPYEL